MSRLDRVIADFSEYGDARIVPVDPELVRDLAAIAAAALLIDRWGYGEYAPDEYADDFRELRNALQHFEEPR